MLRQKRQRKRVEEDVERDQRRHRRHAIKLRGSRAKAARDTAFFKQRRACWDKKIQFKYGKSDALSWERKAGDEKYDPSPAAPIDYEKHYRQLQTERAHNKQLRLKNSASTLRLGDHANDYWHSNHAGDPGA